MPSWYLSCARVSKIGSNNERGKRQFAEAFARVPVTADDGGGPLWHDRRGGGRGKDQLALRLALAGLTLLAPDIVEAILDGRQPEAMTLPGLMEPFPVEWERQQATVVAICVFNQSPNTRSR